MERKNIWIASGIAAGVAAAAFYLIKKNRKTSGTQTGEDINNLQTVPVETPSRHITDVFAKAKKQQA